MPVAATTQLPPASASPSAHSSMHACSSGALKGKPFGILIPQADVPRSEVRSRLALGFAVSTMSSLLQPLVVAGRFKKSVLRVGENSHRGALLLLASTPPWHGLPEHQFSRAPFTVESSQGPLPEVVDDVTVLLLVLLLVAAGSRMYSS